VCQKKRRVELDGDSIDVDELRCRYCPSEWHVTKHTNNVLQTINEHGSRESHRKNRAADQMSQRIDHQPRLVENPVDFQEKMVLALMRDGLSVEFTEGQFFKNFLAPRFPQFASIQTARSLRSVMVKAYSSDESVIKKCMAKKLFWLGIDETPDSMNRPLLHVMATYLDLNFSDPKTLPTFDCIRRVLIASDSIEGKCGADIVVERVEVAAKTLDLDLSFNIGLSSDQKCCQPRSCQRRTQLSGHWPSSGHWPMRPCST
jgi:hypothetical protein